MLKVVVLHNIITPYRVHQFNEMGRFYFNKNIQFKVIFLSRSDKNRHWSDFNIEFDYEILDHFAIRVGSKDLFTFFINWKILAVLNKEIPDKIICFGWDHLAAYISNHWANKNGKEFILWSGSTKYETSWRRTLFYPLVKYIIKKTAKFIVDGTRHKQYLIQLGANPNDIEIFYFQVDIHYFEKYSKTFSDIQKVQFKKQLGIETSKIIFFNGQLIERKGIFELLYGFKLYQKEDGDISLLILGNGREKIKMQEMIKKESIEHVVFADFVQYDEVYKYYSISDLLILPSREEAWGLVVNEAMACGLSIITTKVTGCSDDLIDEGINGYVIPTNCIECIAKAIRDSYNKKLTDTNNSQHKINKFKMKEMITNSSFLGFDKVNSN